MANDSRSRSPDSLFVSENESEDHERRVQPRHTNNYLALPRRHIGDGLDFRRPVMSGGGGMRETGNMNGNNQMVIDLTDEDDTQRSAAHAIPAHETEPVATSSRAQRPPRFGRNIIDLDSEEEGHTDHQPTAAATRLPPLHNQHQSYMDNHLNIHPQYSILRRPQRTNNSHPSASMDEIQFLEERSRPRPQADSRSRTPAAHPPRSVTPYPAALNAPIDLTGDDDDVVHLDTRARPGGVNAERPAITGGLGTIAVEDDDEDDGAFGFANILSRVPRLAQRLDDAGHRRAQEERYLQLAHHRHRNVGTNQAARRHQIQPRPFLLASRAAMPGGPLAVAMDYGMIGFDLGFEGANQPPPPKYEPPEPAADGFTRSPEEDEEVVCPNCGDELAMGDTEDKQQVWVIKKCGHVSPVRTRTFFASKS